MTNAATDRGRPATTTPHGSVVDVASYLRRVREPPTSSTDLAQLRRLHRAHVTSIPFENIDVALERPVSLDLDAIQDKLIHRHRGGYCYEHNRLFAAVLAELGYRVELLVARVQPTRPGPRTHMALRVEVDGRAWLADVGFGGPAQMLEPVPLETGDGVDQAGWRYRVVPGAFPGSRLLQATGSDGWQDQYAFTLEPHYPIDYDIYNYNASTNPASPFVGRLVVQANAGRVRHRLVDGTLQTVNPRRPATATGFPVPPDDLRPILDELFGISLTDDEARLLSSVVRRDAATRT